MDWTLFTKALLAIALGLFVAYDVVAFLRGGVQATISRVTLGWARRWPLLPLLVGVVLGHLFWPQPVPSLCLP